MSEYKWDHWFSEGSTGFSLRKGRDYQCSTMGMIQQVRNRAARLGCRLKFAEDPDGLGFTVTIRSRAAVPPRPYQPPGRPPRRGGLLTLFV